MKIRRPLCLAWGGGVREEQSMVLTAPQQWIRCHRCLFGPVPCGRVAKAPIAVCVRSGCEGVRPFRIRCQRASFLSLCRLPHVFCPPMCSPTAVCGPVPVCFKAPCGQVANVLFFALPELGLCWRLAFSDPLPTSFIFVSVQVRLPHDFCPPMCSPSGCRCVRLCLRTGPLVFSSRGSKGATSAPGEWSFFALPEPGFRWCSAVSDPLPSGCRFAFVRSRLRHVFC